MTKGWWKQSPRHALARKGIKTKPIDITKSPTFDMKLPESPEEREEKIKETIEKSKPTISDVSDFFRKEGLIYRTEGGVIQVIAYVPEVGREITITELSLPPNWADYQIQHGADAVYAYIADRDGLKPIMNKLKKYKRAKFAEEAKTAIGEVGAKAKGAGEVIIGGMQRALRDPDEREREEYGEEIGSDEESAMLPLPNEDENIWDEQLDYFDSDKSVMVENPFDFERVLDETDAEGNVFTALAEAEGDGNKGNKNTFEINLKKRKEGEEE